MSAEAVRYTSLSTHSLTGIRSLPTQRLGLKVGCYVLSATSQASPWARLLEARALFWLKGRLAIEVEEVTPTAELLSIKGKINAHPEESAWDHTSLTQALSALKLVARLSPVGVDVAHSDPPPELVDALASLSTPSKRSSEGSSPQLYMTWSAQLPFPHHEEAKGSDYLVSLHLSRGLHVLPEELLLPQAVSPSQVRLLYQVSALLSQLDVWLALILGYFSLTHLTRRWSARRERRATISSAAAQVAPALQWSPAPSRSSRADAPRGASIEEVGFELCLRDQSSGARLNASPSVTLSTPDPIFDASPTPQLTPTHPLSGALLSAAQPGVTWVSLPSERAAALQRGEALWLWVSLPGYEGCVVTLRASHIRQRLTLPLWDLRAALKRQLSALSARRRRPGRFGREALEALRAQLDDPALSQRVLQAEALLYHERALNERLALEVAWALSEGSLSDALSPYDARARTSVAHSLERSPHRAALAHTLWLLTSLCVALSLSATLLYASPAEGSPELSFKGWRHLISESCHAPAPAYRALSLQRLLRAERVVLVNPYAIPSELLDWVKSGGRLLVALEPEGAQRSQAFLARLDLSLSPPSLDLTHQAASGVWWSEYALDQAHLPPFLGTSVTHFLEGPSWYQHEIAPTWVDELGRSLGYRVKVGRGSLFLFGDADALSDHLLSVASNQLSALAFIEWLLSGAQELSCPLILLPPGHIQGAASIDSRLSESTLHTLSASIRAWLESLAQWLSRLFSSSYGNQLASTLCLGLWLVILSRKHLRS